LHLERLAVLALQRDGLALGRGDEVHRRPRRDVSTASRATEASEAAAGLAEPARPEAAFLLVEHREDVVEVLGGLRTTPAALAEHREHILEAARALAAGREAR